MAKLTQLEETRFRQFIAPTIPTTYRGELSALEILLKALQQIDDFEGVVDDIDYKEIYDRLVNNQEFREKFLEFVKDYLDSLALGTGNINGYYDTDRGGKSIGVYYGSKIWHNHIDSTGNIVDGYSTKYEAANILGHVMIATITLRIREDVIGSVPDGTFTHFIVADGNVAGQANGRAYNKYFHQGFSNRSVTIPYGDSTFYMGWSIGSSATYNSDTDRTTLFTFYSSGISINTLNANISGDGYAYVTQRYTTNYAPSTSQSAGGLSTTYLTGYQDFI